MNALLSVSNLSISHGGISAVRGSNIEVKQGEIIALLGPNGAGKSSTLRGIVGLVNSKGNVIFDGEDIAGLSTEKIISAGISLVPEGRRLFPNLTVKENLILGAPRKANTKEVYEELLQRLPILESRSNQTAGTLSGGEQQQVAVARALMSKPKLLLIDEPSLGLAPTIVDAIYGLLSDLRSSGLSMIIVEQEVHRVLKFADRGYAMSSGDITVEGDAKELLLSDEIKKVYLGENADE